MTDLLLLPGWAADVLLLDRWQNAGDEVPSGASDNVRVAVKVMQQVAVYWEITGVDEFGKPTYQDAIEISCRWEDVQEVFITANGEKAISKAQLIVDRDLKNESVIFLGLASDLTDILVPKNNDGAWEIRWYGKLPDFKGKKFLREVML